MNDFCEKNSSTSLERTPDSFFISPRFLSFHSCFFLLVFHLFVFLKKTEDPDKKDRGTEKSMKEVEKRKKRRTPNLDRSIPSFNAKLSLEHQSIQSPTKGSFATPVQRSFRMAPLVASYTEKNRKMSYPFSQHSPVGLAIQVECIRFTLLEYTIQTLHLP